MKSDAWPFVPPAHHKSFDESPFRIRGSVYAGYITRIQKELPGGLSAICSRIDNKTVETFLSDTIFLATATYDIKPLMHLMRVTAPMTHAPLDKFIREGSRHAAERDVVGTYRAQLRSASAEEMATRLPRIFDRYFDPCRAESHDIQANSCEMQFWGLPASALGFYIWANEGFVTGALEAAGGKDVHFVWSNAMPDGELEGVALQNIVCRISWKNS